MLINCVKKYPVRSTLDPEHSDMKITDNARIDLATKLTAAGLGPWNEK